MTAPDDVYVAAATASVRTEGVNDGYIASTARDEPFRAAVDVAYAAGIAEGRRQAAYAIREAGGAFPDIRRQCANLADHGDVNDREPA